VYLDKAKRKLLFQFQAGFQCFKINSVPWFDFSIEFNNIPFMRQITILDIGFHEPPRNTEWLDLRINDSWDSVNYFLIDWKNFSAGHADYREPNVRLSTECAEAATQWWTVTEESMKIAALVALSVLIALQVEAGERQNNVSPACDNDGRCTTLSVTAPTSNKPPNLDGQIGTSERKLHRVVDANGNTTMVTVQTAYGFNINVHPAYASKFLKFFALLKDRG
jgi:hypothetical protein